MSKSHKKVRVKSVEMQHGPEQIRRIGRALIALARAQLEADAEAEATERSKKVVPLASKRRTKANPSSGDAA